MRTVPSQTEADVRKSKIDLWRSRHGARATDMRRRMIENGLQAKLWALLENIARTAETPERRKARQMASSATTEAANGTDGVFSGTSGSREAFPTELERLDGAGHHTSKARGAMELKAGKDLDELALNCLGAISLMLRSEQAKEALLAGPDYHPGLGILLELAIVEQKRWGSPCSLFVSDCKVCRTKPNGQSTGGVL